MWRSLSSSRNEVCVCRDDDAAAVHDTSCSQVTATNSLLPSLASDHQEDVSMSADGNTHRSAHVTVKGIQHALTKSGMGSRSRSLRIHTTPDLLEHSLGNSLPSWASAMSLGVGHTRVHRGGASEPSTPVHRSRSSRLPLSPNSLSVPDAHGTRSSASVSPLHNKNKTSTRPPAASRLEDLNAFHEVFVIPSTNQLQQTLSSKSLIVKAPTTLAGFNDTEPGHKSNRNTSSAASEQEPAVQSGSMLHTSLQVFDVQLVSKGPPPSARISSLRRHDIFLTPPSGITSQTTPAVVGRMLRDLTMRAEAASHANDWKRECLVRFQLGCIYELTSQYEEALCPFEKLHLCATLSNDTASIAVALNRIGVNHFRLGRYQQSAAAHKSIVDMQQSLDMDVALLNLGVAYRVLEDHAAARSCLRRCLHLSQENRNKVVHRNCLGQIGVLCWKLDEPDQALSYLERCLALTEPEKQHHKHVYLALTQLLGEIFAKQKSWEMAIEFFSNAWQISKKLKQGDVAEYCRCQMGIASGSLKMEQAFHGFSATGASTQTQFKAPSE